MEEGSALFSLSVDPVTKTHLSETAKWARFLAIIGFIFLLLFIGVGIYSSILIGRYSDMYSGYRQRSLGATLGMGTAVSYIIAAVFAFFPLLYMLRFANGMKRALASDDQALLNASFQNLKIYFRYLGIVTIIALVLVALSLFFAIAGSAL